MTPLSDRLLKFFAERGCTVPEIGLLQPADPLLDTAGEDMRRRIFITADQHGASLCLRPEFTIPVCLHHLTGGGKARYAYAGTVFRQRMDEPAEFMQAGVEDIGEEDRVAADAAAIRDCTEAVKRAGVTRFRIVLGDQALFEAVLAALDLPPSWQKRLGRAFGDIRLLRDDIDRLSSDNGSTAELPHAVAKMVDMGDREGVRRWVSARMSESGLPASGGRNSAEIAERVMEKAELAAARLDRSHRRALDAFLDIEIGVGEAPGRLAEVAGQHGLAIDAALAEFGARVSALEAAGLLSGDAIYRAAFGRRLDYYTGLVFEIVVDGLNKPVAGGGRYDRLMSLLGSELRQPAVGFSIWLDRLKAAAGDSQ